MPKKKTSKTSKEVKEKEVVVKEEKKPASLKSEIDEIFAGKKRKKSQIEKPKVDECDKVKKVKKRSKNEKEFKDGFGEPASRERKRTADGLTIFTEEELGVANAEAGGTPLCPFDCSCCF